MLMHRADTPTTQFDPGVERYRNVSEWLIGGRYTKLTIHRYFSLLLQRQQRSVGRASYRCSALVVTLPVKSFSFLNLRARFVREWTENSGMPSSPPPCVLARSTRWNAATLSTPRWQLPVDYQVIERRLKSHVHNRTDGAHGWGTFQFNRLIPTTRAPPDRADERCARRVRPAR